MPLCLRPIGTEFVPDGYFGVGDKLTLKIRVRIDNMVDDKIDFQNYDLASSLPTSYLEVLRPEAAAGRNVPKKLKGYSNGDVGQLDDVFFWNGGSSTAYLTVHDTTLDWLDPDNGGAGWTHRWAQDGVDANGAAHTAGTLAAAKPTMPSQGSSAGVVSHPYGFAAQSPQTFRYVNSTEDHEEMPITSTNPHPLPRADHDCDDNLGDVYTYAESGWFTIWRPTSSVRGDTLSQRQVVGDPDTGENGMRDPGINTDVSGSEGGEGDEEDDNAVDDDTDGMNHFLVTQAVNTGGAVNSFIVDWQVPYYATRESTNYDALLPNPGDGRRPGQEVVRVKPCVNTVRTGVWEVPGAEYDAGGNALNDEARTEQDLRLFVYIRVARSSTVADPSVTGYGEQNGTQHNKYENYSIPSTDADRDYFFGEDDAATDGNTAPASGKWILIGEQSGYPVSDKTNRALDVQHEMVKLGLNHTYSLGRNGSYDVRQVRWVIKSVPSNASDAGALQDNSETYAKPVPHGFRLAVDAVPYDDSTEETRAYSAGSQEADEVDPMRCNIGWERAKNADGTYKGKFTGTSHDWSLVKEKSGMPASVVDNSAGIVCETIVTRFVWELWRWRRKRRQRQMKANPLGSPQPFRFWLPALR